MPAAASSGALPAPRGAAARRHAAPAARKNPDAAMRPDHAAAAGNPVIRPERSMSREQRPEAALPDAESSPGRRRPAGRKPGTSAAQAHAAKPGVSSYSQSIGGSTMPVKGVERNLSTEQLPSRPSTDSGHIASPAHAGVSRDLDHVARQGTVMPLRSNWPHSLVLSVPNYEFLTS